MANLAPFPVFRAFDSLGKPLIGGKLFTYVAGTTTPKVTYQDSTGAVANTNPVILDSRGEANVWLDGVYSLVLQDANGITQWTVDNVQGVGTGDPNGGTVTASEWLDQPDSPTYVSPTQYTVPGDRTAVYHVGRRQRAQVSGGIAYSTIIASEFSTGTTTITVANDSIALDGGISAVAVGINSADNPSISVDCVAGIGTLDTITTGMIFMWPLGFPPSGYLLCDGAAVDRTTYAALFTLIGETFGAGDGSTTFNVPDFRGRSPLGFGESPDSGEGGGTGTARSLAEKVGAETHTQAANEVGVHSHPNATNVVGRPPTGGLPLGDGGTSQAGLAGGSTQDNSGPAQPMNNMHPSLGIGFVIKT